jgi:hypothetical protein
MGVYQGLGDACIHCKVETPSMYIKKDSYIYTHLYNNLKFNTKHVFSSLHYEMSRSHQ